MQNESGSLFEDMRISPSFQIIAVALSLVSSQVARAEFTPVLSEIMASNDSVLADEDGEFPDWIEIQNVGTTAGNLEGWFLTDDAGNLTRWAFPPVPLAPSEFVIVFASKKNRASADAELHANFKLSGDGEFLALVAADGITSSSAFDPAYPQQFADVSYGLGPDGATTGYFTEPTPGTQNGQPGRSPVAPVEFNPGSQVFTTSLQVALSTPTDGTTIFYTTDGTEPSASNGSVYTAPITIAATTEIRARAQFSNEEAGSVITSSYGTVTGARDGNQASPMWGQFITPDIGAAGGPHGTLYLQSLSYQAADDGTRATGEVYLHAYTTFSTSGGGAVTGIGGFTAASTSTVNLGAIGGDGTLTWDFAGNDAFDGATSYMFVASTSPTEVTFADTSSLVGAAYALDVGDLYAGGDSLRGNGNNSGWDQHFEATFNTSTAPEQAGASTRRLYVKLAPDTQTFTSPLPIVVLDNSGAGSVPRRNSSTGPNGNDGSGVIQVPRQPVLMAIYERDGSGQASPADVPAIVSYAGLRVRGSSSASLAKKPFSLETWQDGEFENPQDIAPFGMPPESDWVLYAPTETFGGNRYDRPLLHNSFIYQLSNEIGRYAARTQFVELFLNTGGGELSMADYAGIYILMEKVKRGGDRIDFRKLSQDGTEGGWMINADRMDPLPIGGVGTPRHFHTPGPNQILQTANDSPFGVRNIDDRPEFYHSFFNFESPGGYSINRAQRVAIERTMNYFEDALYGPDWTDPALGYAAWIDVDNFIDHFILHNLTKNQDAFVLSTWLYRTGPSDKLNFGPVWDFDRGYTTSPTNTNPAANLLWAANRMWFPRLFADIDFEQKYIDRWQELRDGAFATTHLHEIIDTQKAEITEAVALRNGTANWPGKVAAMKNWLADRCAAIDAQFVPRPEFIREGGGVPVDFEVVMRGTSGTTIYYTVDGTDPRLPGGGISPRARSFDGGVIDTSLVTFGTECRYFIPTDDSLGQTWTGDPDSFDDGAWSLATPGLGWENTETGTLVPAITTDIKSQMKGTNASGYFRWRFDFDNAERINALLLRVSIDDGFVAYLNGTWIGDFNAPDPSLWNSAANGTRRDTTVLSTPIEIDASAFKSAVRNGSNTLAIQGMNTDREGLDFLIDAALEVNHSLVASSLVLIESSAITARALDGTEWSGPSTATFVVGRTPADSSNLVVSEIMYNPPGPNAAEIAAGILDGDQFEYIELLNISAGEIDLSGVAFINGIDFTFPVGPSSILQPGERILVVKNVAAFELRYGVGPGDRIAGEFANDFNLRNSGEHIELVDVIGIPIRDFSYDDKAPWPGAADNGGFSIVLDLPNVNPDHNLPGSWRSSAVLGGSPGSSDTQPFAGDPQADNDGDGLPRLLEHALASSDDDPTSGPDAIGFSVESFTIADVTDDHLVFAFRRNLTAEGIRYTVEHSSDLLGWEAGGAILIDEHNLGDGTAIVRYRNLAPLSESRRGFLRLRIDLE